MSYEHNGDRIVYTLIITDDLNKAVIAAHYSKAEALAQIERAKTPLTLVPQVVDVAALRKQILDRMNPIERLVMDPPTEQKRRGQ